MNPLFVPELFLSILSHLVSSSPQFHSRRTLAALARTCTAFSEPSLDFLWRSLDSLWPLVLSFADVVDEARVKTSPSAQEWLIINRYSHRIQELTLGDEWLSVLFLECTKLVLPNLIVVRWPQRFALTRPTIFLSSLQLLLTPKLNTLQVRLNNVTDPTLLSLLAKLTHLCPDLQSIYFDFNGPLPLATTEALTQTICGRTNWHSVRFCQPVDNVALRFLSLSSTLKTVYLTFSPDTARPDFGHRDTPFRNITSMTLALSDRLDVAMHILRPRDQAFHTFEVSLYNTQPTSVDTSALLRAIVSPPRIHSLRSLFVTHHSSPDIPYGTPLPAPGVRGFSYEGLHCIASLVHLHTLILNLGYPIMINDEEFALLVCNWPYLEALRFTGDCDEFTNAITLKGLLSLLISCPKLHFIALSLDAQQVPLSASDKDVGLCRPLVTDLEFQDSPILDPILVGAFLLRHLPAVNHARTWFSFRHAVLYERYSEPWKQVNLYMEDRRQDEDEIVGQGDSLRTFIQPESL